MKWLGSLENHLHAGRNPIHPWAAGDSIEIPLAVAINDRIGLAGSTVPARLETGDYIAVHTYGWTEFNIDRSTGSLRVTTYGIASYTRAQMEADPQAVTARVPVVVSQFSVDAR